MEGLKINFKKNRKMKIIDGEVFVAHSDLTINVEALDHYAEYMQDMADKSEKALSKATFLHRKKRVEELSEMMKGEIEYCANCRKGHKDIQTGFSGLEAAAIGQQINDRE